MGKELIPYIDPEGRGIRANMGEDGQPMFVAKDVCEALGIKDVSMAMSRLSPTMKGTSTIGTLGGPQEMLMVSQAGVYKLVFSSRKPEAERFTDWLATEVIPAIKKTGSYSMNRIPAYPEAVRLYAAEIEKGAHLAQQLAIAAPKVEAYNDLIDCEGTISISELSKLLRMCPIDPETGKAGPPIGPNITY